MATQAFIYVPKLVRQKENMNIQRAPITDGSNSFLAGALVKISSAALATLATADVTIYGQTPDASHAATDKPPTALYGEMHYPWDLGLGAELEINVGAANGSDVTIGASAKTPGDVAVGTSYGILVPTTGAYAGVPFLDPTNTTNLIFKVVAFVDGVGSTDYNGRVRVTIVPTTIQ